MGMTPFPVHGKQKSADICAAFMQGCGDKNQDAAVFYGVVDSNYFTWKRVLKSGRPYYYIDNSYFDKSRETHYRITKGNVQHQGTESSDGKRWAALGYTIKSWRRPIETDHVLLVPQSDVFMRCVAEYPRGADGWVADHLALAERTWPGRPVVIRAWGGNKIALSKTLHQDLEGAAILLTYSSAAAIEAVIEGVQATVASQSAISRMICSTDFALDQRVPYFQTLADNQWTLEEIKRGDAWRWLNR